MKLTNQAQVAAPADDVFAVFTDVERVASCLPGAVIEGQEGDEHLGRVKIKVGPVSMTYAGRLRFLEVDEGSRTLRLKGKGEDINGNGDAEAEVTVTVDEDGGQAARLLIETDMVISGKIVAFGKGAISSVADRILQQFANNLANLLKNGETVEAASTPRTDAPAQRAAASPGSAPHEESFDGLGLLLPEEARRKLAIAGAFAAGMVQGWLIVRAFGRRR
ncbi:SRPBCC family protein [Nesterenkonia populi]|uniref:SRPBCC family protein n=1 Tax=Nesterenkonia populi TaxID=1591087 RepID=UPI0011BE1BFE|nr:SRPBCC family protein [Nesterenkonia populi]